jgi:hypothetical protein
MWEILKIEKTKDANVIKSAFTKMRGTVQSQDAKLLSIAYEMATRRSKIKDTAESYKEEMLLEMAFVRYWKKHMAKTAPELDTSTVNNDVDLTVIAMNRTRSAMGNDFYAQMQKVYDNFFVRRELINWQSLIQQNASWNTAKAELEQVIQDFLILHRNLPSEVWMVFDEEYNWNGKINELIEANADFAKALLAETCPRWPMDYTFVKRENVFDFENYLKYRRLMREAALDNDSEQVRANFDFSIDIYTNDPTLYEIAADFYASQPAFNKYGEFGPEFLHALNKLIKIHLDDNKYLPERAEYFKRCEYFEEARDDYETAMKLSPENLRLPFEIADMYNQQNMSGKAKPYLKHIKKIYEKTQQTLEKQMGTAADREKVSAIIDSNDRVIGEVFDMLK